MRTGAKAGMVERSHWRRASTWAVISAAMFIYVCVIVLAHKAGYIDDNLIRIVQGWESPGMTDLMETFTWLGSTKVAIIIALVAIVVLAVLLRHRKELVLFILVVGLAPLLNRLIKSIFERERPTLHRLIEEVGYSFPSGHSMSAFTMYAILTYLLWRHVQSAWGRTLMIVIGLALTLCIGISRIYLGVHYPSDVIGGFLISGAWVGLSIEVFERTVRRKG